MWELRDLKFGGLNRRYKDGKGRLERAVDPFAECAVKLSTDLKFDNWLLRVFTPGVISCHEGPILLTVLCEGRFVRAHCDLITKFRDGSCLADAVVSIRTPRTEAAWSNLKIAAPAHGLRAELRTRQEIRGNKVLLENLDYMRQYLVVHAHERDTTLEKAVVDVFARSDRTTFRVEEVARTLLNTPDRDEAFISGLFRLYRQGVISINISEVRYGCQSEITLVK